MVGRGPKRPLPQAGQTRTENNGVARRRYSSAGRMFGGRVIAMKRYSHRHIKSRHTYNVGEAARAMGVSPATVRTWIKKGLAVVPGIHPSIIRGIDLTAFLHKQRQSLKSPCGPGRLYCLSCKAPKRPAFGQVEFIADGPELGSLTALCPDCATVMKRRSSRRSLSTALGDLTLIHQQVEVSLSGPSEPC
jgi:hypothetical protein